MELLQEFRRVATQLNTRCSALSYSLTHFGESPFQCGENRVILMPSNAIFLYPSVAAAKVDEYVELDDLLNVSYAAF